jgi:hypothetical protein
MCIAPHPQVKKVAQAAAASRSVAALIVSEQQGSAAATSEGENGAGSSAEKQHEPDSSSLGNRFGSADPHKRQKRTHGEHNQQAQGNICLDDLQQVSLLVTFPGVRVGIGLQIV